MADIKKNEEGRWVVDGEVQSPGWRPPADADIPTVEETASPAPEAPSEEPLQ